MPPKTAAELNASFNQVVDATGSAVAAVGSGALAGCDAGISAANSTVSSTVQTVDAAVAGVTAAVTDANQAVTSSIDAVNAAANAALLEAKVACDAAKKWLRPAKVAVISLGGTLTCMVCFIYLIIFFDAGLLGAGLALGLKFSPWWHIVTGLGGLSLIASAYIAYQINRVREQLNEILTVIEMVLAFDPTKNLEAFLRELERRLRALQALAFQKASDAVHGTEAYAKRTIQLEADKLNHRLVDGKQATATPIRSICPVHRVGYMSAT
jgi:hypothetical protein